MKRLFEKISAIKKMFADKKKQFAEKDKKYREELISIIFNDRESLMEFLNTVVVKPESMKKIICDAHFDRNGKIRNGVLDKMRGKK